MPRSTASRMPAPGRPCPDGPSARQRPGTLALALLLGLTGLAADVRAQAVPAPAAASQAESTPEPSALDAPMFYQLMIAEVEANAGRLGNAYEIMLDAARRLNDPALYERAVGLAVQGRSGDSALAATQAWRKAQPQSLEAVRTQVQMLAATDRLGELGEPLRSLLRLSPPEQRSAIMAGLPRFLESAKDRAGTLQVAEEALGPYLNQPDSRTMARTALGRIALAAGQPERAFQLARQALADDPAAAAPAVLAIELMPSVPAAETLVQGALAQSGMPPTLRLTYARMLEQRQRLVEAVQQMRQALADQPDLPQGWMSLGAMLMDMHRPAEATQALQRAFDELQRSPPAEAVPTGEGTDRLQDLLVQLLAQSSLQQGDTRAAAQWLGRIPADRVTLAVLSRQAELLADQGQLAEGRRRLREAPAADQPEPGARLLAEVQLLRHANRWQDSYQLLRDAVQREPENSGLIYELAMSAERLQRYDEMESLLRRVAALKPEDAQTYNALGYSLAERNLRLDEAGELIERALKLSPGDPYITDSLGWLAYRRGQLPEAERLLRQAWGTRPHPDVAAHLGEVLWAQGRKDEAMAIWRDGLAGGQTADAVRQTMARLKAPAQ